MTRPETDPREIPETRDRLIDAAVPHVPFDGWGRTALRHAAADIGVPAEEAEALFPKPARDMISWHSRLADRRMLAALRTKDLENMKIRERIATGVMTRLEQNADQRDAVRKAIAVLALPGHAGLSLQLLYRTVDDIWFAAGDRSTDWNFYTKRMLLGGVYSSTLLVWLDDRSEDLADTRAFLARRIENVMQVPKLTGRLKSAATALPRRAGAFRHFRPPAMRRSG